MSANSWSRFRRFLGKGEDQVTLETALDQRDLSERQFRILVENVVDYGIYMLDASGRVTTWNQGAERIKGYTAKEIIGQHFSCFYTKDDRRKELPQRALETAAQEGKFTGEGWRVRQDGSQFWANVVIQAIRDEDGELIGFAKVTQDVTERLKQQDALAKAQAAFVQAQKMEAVDQLSGGVAHDFNNILTSIIGSIDLLERRGDVTADEPRHLFEIAKRSAERGTSLTQRLLAFSRKQALEPRPLDANRLGPGNVRTAAADPR